MGDIDANLKKLVEIKQALNAKFYERESEIEGMLLALLAKQHMLMIGPAGTAKSALSAELATIVKGTEYFQWLLTPFSTPEEVFGPLSLNELEAGVYKRNTATKMPEAHIVFLDEIFKANSAILNSLLTLINERLFYNDSAPVEVPLISVIGASNEYPEDGEGLEALFDRFLLRYEIDFIEDERNFVSMMKEEVQVEMPSMQLEQLQQLIESTKCVAISDEVYEALASIRRELADEGIHPSDRRFKQSLRLLQAKALLNERDTVQTSDLSILEHVLWETVDQKEKVASIVSRNMEDSPDRLMDAISKEAEEVYDAAVRDQSIEAGREAMEKISFLLADLQRLKEHNPDQADKIDALADNLTSLQHEVEASRVDTASMEMASEKEDDAGSAQGIYFRM